MSENQSYNTRFVVNATAKQVFDAITNPRGWWSEAIEGDTDRLGAVFYYHYQDVHRATFKISELVPGERIVWHVLNNDFNFIQDKSEWVDTDVVFEIVERDGETEVRFTHVGLVPDYECYDVCTNAWGSYITSSLRNLIVTGTGQPNPIEEIVSQARQMREQNYTTSFTVDQSPEAVFAAVNHVRGWWSEDIEGPTDRLGAEFKITFGDVHRSTQKITELIPGQRVVWHITESRLNFLKTQDEWTGTDVVFEITRKNDRTELRFTHIGLIPDIECYDVCSDTWGIYINHSLFTFITQGQGKPARENAPAQSAAQ